jgi:thiamine pyrophosphate-dependent acetolactate synthase large subunit-like protein
MSDAAEPSVYFHSAIARALKDNGVTTIFGLIGDANLYMVDAFIREQQGEYVSAANEAGAVIMALGYVADAIVRALNEAEIPGSGFRTQALGDALAGFSPVAGLPDMGTSTTVDSRRAVHRLGKVAPEQRTVVADGGRFMGSAWQYLDVPEPRAYVHGINFGAIGLGVAYGVGAAVGAKGRPTLVVCGDGGFMLGGLVEFNTAVRHGLDLIVILCNDSAYGAEHVQFRNKNMDPSLSMFAWPEFADVARSLGGDGVTVRNAADLEAAEAAIRTRIRPLLIDLKCDPDHMPPIPL